ncbi:MAG: Holliday junction branch migration protein RuvA [Victivallales bacterium]|nr:Holliday junction branch migration protein RuvA [Victivallales bacterium]
MIAQLTGTLVDKNLTEIVIDCNGVGYAVSVPLSTSEALPAPGTKATVLTTMTVREDDIHLYGFATASERKLFLLLTATVSGVGPKLALNVLSSMKTSDFASAILNSDIKLLSKISGIGKRTAERMVVELRDKVSDLAEGTSTTAVQSKTMMSDAENDAIAALITLGFKHDQAEAAVLRVIATVGQQAPAADLIRKALALLNS